MGWNTISYSDKSCNLYHSYDPDCIKLSSHLVIRVTYVLHPTIHTKTNALILAPKKPQQLSINSELKSWKDHTWMLLCQLVQMLGHNKQL